MGIEAARGAAWLVTARPSSVQVLVLPKTLPLDGADLRLLSSEGFLGHSASALRTLMHAGPDVQPLLHRFKRLKQVGGTRGAGGFERWPIGPSVACRLALHYWIIGIISKAQ